MSTSRAGRDELGDLARVPESVLSDEILARLNTTERADFAGASRECARAVERAGQLLTMTFNLEQDFDALHITSCKSFYHEQVDRFENITPGCEYTYNYNQPAALRPGVRYYMYWFGDNASDALLARKMLEASRHEVFALWDLASDDGDDGSHCLLTDYATPSERRGALNVGNDTT